MSTTTKDLQALQELGLSEIEALVYTYLVGTESATGYRISHAIGKPTANTYKAIAALEREGAVIVDEGENRLVRAVPPEELLQQLQRRFERRREEASEVLKKLTHNGSEEGVYTLKDVDQVLERARAMLRRTERIALLDVFPAVFREVQPDLEAAAKRGVRVVAKVYERVEMKGIETVREPHPGRVFEFWPGEQLTLVRDAEEHLIGLLARDLGFVHQAVWSNSLYLSCMHHNHVAAEIAAFDEGGRKADPSAKGVAGPVGDISLLSSGAPGLSKLIDRTARLGKKGTPA